MHTDRTATVSLYVGVDHLVKPRDCGIGVGKVVRLAERPFAVVACCNPDANTCPLIGASKLSRMIQAATCACVAVQDDLTLADIASNRARLLDRIVPLADDGRWRTTASGLLRRCRINRERQDDDRLDFEVRRTFAA